MEMFSKACSIYGNGIRVSEKGEGDGKIKRVQARRDCATDSGGAR